MMDILSNYTCQKQYRWLTLDVTSLYTSIKHEFGLAAIQHFLCKDQLFHHQQIQFLYDSIEFSSTNFSCLGKHRQIQGTAMRARFAPSYANLFMGYWEHFNIWSHNPYGVKLVLYARYIDDILIIWNGTEEQLEGFLHHCQNNQYGICFTHVLASHSLIVLDLELRSTHDGSILSKMHFKPSAGNSYLHANTNHHPCWIKNVAFGQFCRLKRICTLKQD